eukprot:COSAG02_NODE_6643_length_3441_cov_2.342908_2_plen_65_part_00
MTTSVNVLTPCSPTVVFSRKFSLTSCSVKMMTCKSLLNQLAFDPLGRAGHTASCLHYASLGGRS